ncbi:MAG TPA: DinB family protein [Candidatus Angelobacter sp.]|nr:DinB family protein [Candidatus Angelobacter sp.]
MSPSSSARLQRCETQLRDFLDEALRGISVETVSAPRIEGKWSALENLAHLARYQEIFLERVEKILKQENPAFSIYRAEEDPEWDAWRALAYKEVLARMTASREKIVARLKSLSANDYARTGVHPRFGEMTLGLWLEFFLAHEGHHLYAVLQQVRGR